MCLVVEDEYLRGERDINATMQRLKDFSAYSLTHAEILEQREGVELLALGMFFGMTSNPQMRYKNQERLALLSEEDIDYQGQAEVIEQELALHTASGPGKPQQKTDSSEPVSQLRLL